ncbi:phosphatidylserine decarboxylase [Bacillus sp. FJAT-44921]|uniref:phosphatidylserine decarboxylase n=1 Tax=Alkalihalobacterium alkalicellulosilyticum TaxID=1912214 RepID=UPI000997D988
MKKHIYHSFVELSGNRLNSFLLKSFARSRLSKMVNKSFASYYGLNLQEMERPLEEYKSLNELFIRRLKPDARKIDENEEAIVSPVDGVLATVGTITEQRTFTVKGQTYTLDEMLGSKEKSERYQNGSFVILYLSPSHYHRIHSPISGQIIEQWTLGRKSYPVNELGLRLGKRPLSKNYRLISEFEVQGNKRLSLVKVGALNVNSIHLTHPRPEVKKGEELAYFSFGSTVVLLFEKGLITIPPLQLPHEIKVGETFATFT